jgi:AP-3 complex subunit delta-1
MSLLYECISGIIQGGILEAVEGTAEGEDVAKLCVGKLRGMMVIEGDSNCKLTAKSIKLQEHRLISCSKICRPACL